MLACVVLLFLKLVPRFVWIFKDFDAALPAMTIVMIDVSTWFRYYWYLAVPLVPVYFAGLYLAGRSDGGLQRTWTHVAVVLFVLLAAFSAVALMLPMAALMKKLS
jgi:type IV pilus assembly protein PilC